MRLCYHCALFTFELCNQKAKNKKKIIKKEKVKTQRFYLFFIILYVCASISLIFNQMEMYLEFLLVSFF